MDVRAVSVVLDVVICVLLVGAAAATLATVDSDLGASTGEATADQTAEQLATSTTTVTYTVPVANLSEANATATPRERTVRGSYAELLAVAAVRNATLDGTPVGPGGTYTSGVRDAVDAFAGAHSHAHGMQVRARWRPYPGAPVSGTVVAGERPPLAADVTAVRFTVSSGFLRLQDKAREAATQDGYRGVARVLADGLLAGWVDDRRATVALQGNAWTQQRIQRRYRRLGGALGVNVTPALEAKRATAANANLRPALVALLAADLQDRYHSPTAAARATRLGRVTITVRTWSQ
jgi:hypothetical protein